MASAFAEVLYGPPSQPPDNGQAHQIVLQSYTTYRNSQHRIRGGDWVKIRLKTYNYHRNYDRLKGRKANEHFVYTEFRASGKVHRAAHAFESTAQYGKHHRPQYNDLVYAGQVRKEGGDFILDGGLYELDFKVDKDAQKSLSTALGNAAHTAAVAFPTAAPFVPAGKVLLGAMVNLSAELASHDEVLSLRDKVNFSIPAEGRDNTNIGLYKGFYVVTSGYGKSSLFSKKRSKMEELQEKGYEFFIEGDVLCYRPRNPNATMGPKRMDKIVNYMVYQVEKIDEQEAKTPAGGEFSDKMKAVLQQIKDQSSIHLDKNTQAGIKFANLLDRLVRAFPGGVAESDPTGEGQQKFASDLISLIDDLQDSNELTAAEGGELRRLARNHNEQIAINFHAAKGANSDADFKRRFIQSARELLREEQEKRERRGRANTH